MTNLKKKTRIPIIKLQKAIKVCKNRPRLARAVTLSLLVNPYKRDNEEWTAFKKASLLPIYNMDNLAVIRYSRSIKIEDLFIVDISILKSKNAKDFINQYPWLKEEIKEELILISK